MNPTVVLLYIPLCGICNLAAHTFILGTSLSFLNASLDIHTIQCQLEALYSQPFDPSNVHVESHILSRLHTLWSQEELHWKQRSRI